VAISVAHALVDRFHDAVFFIDLAALTDPQLVPTAVASALGFMCKPRIRSLVCWPLSATRRSSSCSTIAST
jgi:predicted ATPase